MLKTSTESGVAKTCRRSPNHLVTLQGPALRLRLRAKNQQLRDRIAVESDGLLQRQGVGIVNLDCRTRAVDVQLVPVAAYCEIKSRTALELELLDHLSSSDVEHPKLSPPVSTLPAESNRVSLLPIRRQIEPVHRRCRTYRGEVHSLRQQVYSGDAEYRAAHDRIGSVEHRCDVARFLVRIFVTPDVYREEARVKRF